MVTVAALLFVQLLPLAQLDALSDSTVSNATVSDTVGSSSISVRPDSSARLTPRGALWRSALIPGWGQLSMGHPFKAALFFGVGTAWLSAATSEGLRVGDATTALQRQDRAARRNTRVLYYVLTATLAGIDAYVDAHLEDFDIDTGPLDVAGGPGSARGILDAGARVTIRF